MSEITQAMILAAGFGTRMRPLTDTRPKPLIEVAGRALIDHVLDRLVAAGIARVVVNLYYRGEMIRAHLAKRADVEIVFSDESGELLDTGGAIQRALALLAPEPFLVHSSDSFFLSRTAQIVQSLARMWDEQRMDVLMALATRDRAVGYEGLGDFMLGKDGRIPIRLRDGSGHIYSSLQLVHPRLFAPAPAPPFSMNLLWDQAIAEGRLFGWVADDPWLNIDSPAALARVDDFLKRG